ncbi:MAG: C-terminal binding protein [Vicinamibacteraceae bacterium]
MKVLVTDYAWPSLEPERTILNEVGADLLVAETGEEEELVRLAPEASGILTCWKPVTARVLEAASRCVAVGRYGVGLDNIAVRRATELGIVVTNVPTYCVDDVAEHALALLLACARRLFVFDRSIQGGRYGLEVGRPIHRVRGRALGIVGFGNIGRRLARKAQALELEILVFDPYWTEPETSDVAVHPCSLDELLQRSDFVSIHAPLTDDTRGLFGREAFLKMRPGAYLVNTSRGAIVDVAALTEALDQGRLAGAALDVLPEEPPGERDPVLRHPRVLVTPHAAFYSVESILELQETAARQMAAALQGTLPRHIVNPELLQQHRHARLTGRSTATHAAP